jgi:hypothetical protein
MTTRYSIIARLCHQVVDTPMLFGGFDTNADPAIDIGSVHHIYKMVLDTFLAHLDRGQWPEASRARIRMRYTLLARARALALGGEG